jgi:hypothetical protein
MKKMMTLVAAVGLLSLCGAGAYANEGGHGSHNKPPASGDHSSGDHSKKDKGKPDKKEPTHGEGHAGGQHGGEHHK